jgi:N-methylhydantoinase B/oxoprolinase/acetone carboxylase alpha subunit
MINLTPFAFKFNMRRYTKAQEDVDWPAELMEDLATRASAGEARVAQLEALLAQYEAEAYTRPLFSST